MSTFYESINLIYKLWDVTYNRWLSEELFSLSWFVILINTIGIYTILFVYIDKKRLREILLYGSFIAVSFGYIEIASTSIGLWEYKTHFLPFVSGIIPFTYTHPIVHLLVYQYTNSWKTFSVANTIVSLFFAFVIQPFSVWIGILWLGGWTYLYSFIVTMGITFFARALVIWLTNIEQKHAIEPSRASLSPKLQPAMKLLDKDNEDRDYQ